MTPYNRILELHNQGLNNSEIERQIGTVTRKTVITVLQLAEKMSLSYPSDSPMTDTDIHRFLHPKKDKNQRMLNMDDVMFLLTLPNQSIAKIWQTYSEECEQVSAKPYSKSMFQYAVAEARDKYNLSAYESVMELKCVKDAFVDDNDKKHSLLFARIRSSNYAVSAVVRDNKTRSWIHAIIRILKQLDGLPEKCCYIGHLPKAVNNETLDCFRYYGIEFESISAKEANAAFQTWVSKAVKELNKEDQDNGFLMYSIPAYICDEYNLKPFYKDKEFSRKAAHLREIPFLKSFPADDYDLMEYTEVTVQMNYHIEVDGMYYSVPFDYRHEKLTAFISDKTIQICYADAILCVHNRLTGANGRYSTDPDHVSDDRNIPWGETSGRSLRSWAAKIGPNTSKVIDYWLRSKTFEVQAYKLCNTILHMSTTYGNDRLEAACNHSIVAKDMSYTFISETLKHPQKS